MPSPSPFSPNPLSPLSSLPLSLPPLSLSLSLSLSPSRVSSEMPDLSLSPLCLFRGSLEAGQKVRLLAGGRVWGLRCLLVTQIMDLRSRLRTSFATWWLFKISSVTSLASETLKREMSLDLWYS